MNEEKLLSSRMLAAFCWSLVPLFSLPLAFCRILGTKVPFWGSVTGFGIAETGVLSLAVIALFPERLVSLWQGKRFFRRFLCFAALFLLAGTIQQFCFRDAWRNWEITLYYVSLPLAAAALAPELKKLFPFFAAGECILLIVSGFATDHFTGFCGNWNWTQAMILSLFPGLFLLFFLKTPLRWSAAAILFFFLCLLLLYPLEFSRAAFPVMGGAALLLWAGEKINRRWLPSLLFVGIVTFFLLLLFLLRKVPDSRVQLWLGSFALGLDHPLFGSGMGRFGFLLGERLPELYFDTPFAAPLHLHAHNELLWFFCGGGLFGILYLGVLFSAIMRGKCETLRPLFCRWIALTLFLWGMLDMPAATPLGAWWFLSSAGVLLAGGIDEKECRPISCASFRTAAAGIFLLWACSHAVVNFRSTRELRQGRLALYAGNETAAKRYCWRSEMLRPGHEALYELACLSLEREGNWNATLQLLERMENNGVPAYCHSDRLKALALANTGNLPEARKALQREMKRFPRSLIDARLNMEFSPPETRKEAKERFLRLCEKRGISPQAAAALTPEADDAPLPQAR